MKPKINPEWKKLDGKPYGLLLIDPSLHPYREIRIGPKPKKLAPIKK